MNSLLLTAHDYRTPRKANMHFIADELAKHGPMRFFSLRYSALSKWKGDARVFLDGAANRVESVGGVDCYLWKMLVHPFNTRRSSLAPLERWLFRQAIEHPPAILVRWMQDADVIFFESGSAIAHIELAKRINPAARRIYIASDDLRVINVPTFIHEQFQRSARDLDALCIPSAMLAEAMPAGSKCYIVPHGIDAGMLERAGVSPYTASLNAVSVGSMLFDRSFFDVAAAAFPQVLFHVIGSGVTNADRFPDNVRVYGEMAHDDTLRYIKHADVGIAPYAAMQLPAYLTDTSMKLMQYAFFEVPAVCPEAVAGGFAWRHGYVPGASASIASAMNRALAAPAFAAPRYLGWREVTDRLLDPAAFGDTAIQADDRSRAV